jgi:hypothetical protein
MFIVTLGLALIYKNGAATTEKVFNGDDFYSLAAREKRKEDHIIHGQKYVEGEQHNAPGSHQVVTEAAVLRFLDTLTAHDLRLSEDQINEDTAPNLQLPTVDRYHQVKIAQPGLHIDSALVTCQLHNEQVEGGEQFYLRVAIVDPQFFGAADFKPEDFEAKESADRPLAEVLNGYFYPNSRNPKIAIIKLLLDKQGIGAAAALGKQNPQDLALHFSQTVNFFMDSMDLLEKVDHATLGQYPEVAEVVLNARANVRKGVTLTKSEVRQINRALIEVIFPKQNRVTRVAAVPKEWYRGSLNVLHPYLHLLANGEELGLVLTKAGVEKKPGLLDKAGDMRQYYEQVLLVNAKNAQKREPVERLLNNDVTDQDIQAVAELNEAFLGHEFYHLEALHVPWAKLAQMSDAEWEGQQGFSLSALQKRYETSQEIMGSNVYNKNVIKGLHVVRGSKDDVKITKNIVRTAIILETYNDRGSMFKWENYFKLQSYRGVIAKIGARFRGVDLVYVDTKTQRTTREHVKDITKVTHLLALEDLRKAGHLQEAGFTAADLEELLPLLQADEISHPYVRKGDPPLLDWERDMYRANWELSRNFALEGKLGRLEQEHFDKSPFVLLSVKGRYSLQNARADFAPGIRSLRVGTRLAKAVDDFVRAKEISSIGTGYKWEFNLIDDDRRDQEQSGGNPKKYHDRIKRSFPKR